MGQLKKTSLLLKDQKEGAFEKDLKARRLQNPEENMEESYRSLMRHSVQRQVTHSPKYWKDQYDDLLALVDAYGVPQFFLTLTADDCSQLRWEEYGSIEAFAKRFNASATVADAPLESAALFCHRTEKFMELLTSKLGSTMLGKVLRYVIRYEMQGREAVHAPNKALKSSSTTPSATSPSSVLQI